MKLGANHPMGPLALADLVGLDICLSIMDVLYEEFREPEIQSLHSSQKNGQSRKTGTEDRRRIL